MMSSVSHDLKTPLASVIGSLEIYQKMRANLSPEKQEMLIQTALEEAYRLDRFVSNILDMAKLENGLLRANIQKCEINQIVNEVVRKCNEKYAQARVELERPAEPAEAMVDASLLNRAILCVVENAIIHGNEKPVIRISEKRVDDKIIIKICDNGPGIAEENREKIFDKYTRLSHKDHKNAGTGLGLTIARKIMKMLNGQIYLCNINEPGACFKLELPVA